MKQKKKLIGVIFAFFIGLITLMGYVPDNLKTSIKEVNTKETFNENKVINKVEGNVSVSFIDVGQADSILIEEDEKYMLIDAGNNEDGKLLVDYFKSLGIKRFDYLVGTHPHEDHIGGLDDIINNFEIGTIYMPKIYTTTKTFEDVLDAIKNKELKVTTPKINEEFHLNKALLNVVYVGENAKDLNDSSIILKLIYGNNSYLFMGDASKKVEKEILTKEIKADILKVGHHGSNYSTEKNFIEKVNPKYAIISVGENNVYHHPAEETLELLESKNIAIYRTDELGTIRTSSDGTNIKITYEKTNTNK